MPYLKEVAIAGRTVEIRKKYSARYGRKIERSPNVGPTPEKMERYNQQEAERKLRRLINANFGPGDFHMIVSYGGEYNPEPEEARKHLEAFLRKMRRLYEKWERPFRYVVAAERGIRGRRKMHFHMVVNYMETREISELWPWGRVKFFPLDNTGQYADLASYIIKRTSRTFREGTEGFKKRWNQSRNLRAPEVKNYVITAKQWRKEPKAWKGYYLEKPRFFEGVSEVTGYPMQFYSMVKLPEPMHRRI